MHLLPDWHPIETAPLDREVLLKCSDGSQRVAKYSRGALWMLKDDSGTLVLDRSRKSPDAKGIVEATHWK